MNVWSCKVGDLSGPDVPPGADGVMRRAVERAYLELTGRDAEFVFSGFGEPLTEAELAVVEDREPA